MPKASRRWRTSQQPISPSANGRRTCARCAWQRKQPTATIHRIPRAKRIPRKRNRRQDKRCPQPRRRALQESKPRQSGQERSGRRRKGRSRQHGKIEGVAACARRGRGGARRAGQEDSVEEEEGDRKRSGAVGVAGRPAKRRTPYLTLRRLIVILRISLSDPARSRATRAPATEPSIASWSRRRKPAPAASEIDASNSCPLLRPLPPFRDAT